MMPPIPISSNMSKPILFKRDMENWRQIHFYDLFSVGSKICAFLEIALWLTTKTCHESSE